VIRNFDPLHQIVAELAHPKILKNPKPGDCNDTISIPSEFQSQIENGELKESDFQVEIRCLKIDTLYSTENRFPDEYSQPSKIGARFM